MLASLGQMGQMWRKERDLACKECFKTMHERSNSVSTVSRQHIHAFPPCGVTSQRQEKRPDSQSMNPMGEGLAKPPEAADIDCNNACAGLN